MAIGFVRRRVRQQHAGQPIQIRQRVAREAQTHIQPAEIHWVFHPAGHLHARGAVADISLHRERRRLAAQRQHSANLAFTVQFLVVIGSARLPAEDKVACALLLIVTASDLTIRHRFT